MPKLSIVVPVYNVGDLVKKCIESLINQSYSDIEIIIINDGSTDESVKYIEPFLKDKRIKYIYQNNKGLGGARNVGIEESAGEFITFVDSDDWVDLDLYNVMIDRLEKDKSDIAICGIKNEFNNFCCSEERYKYLYSNAIDNFTALSILSRCENNNYLISPVVWNKVYKKKLILDNKISFLKNSYWEDDIFSFQIFMWAKTISIVPEIYYHYYHREKSITNDFSKKHIDDIIYSFKQLYFYIETNKILNCNISNMVDSFFDRAISSMFHMLFCNEQSAKKQKDYIIYFYDKFSKNFSISKAISYLEISRIQRLFI